MRIVAAKILILEPGKQGPASIFDRARQREIGASVKFSFALTVECNKSTHLRVISGILSLSFLAHVPLQTSSSTVMKRCVVIFLGLLVLWSTAVTPAYARRGNPASVSSPQLQFFSVDSDDDHPAKPQVNWVDTLTNHFEWVRVTGFTNTDDGAANIPTATASWNFAIPGFQYTMLSGAVSTNGTIALQPQGQSNQLTNATYAWSKPANRLLPIANLIDTFAVLAPLWGDWEFRTAGDSSKVYIRVTADSAYISYYNLALKGTEGQIRATFQVVFAKDSSITYQYKSFDGTYAGRTAEELIQRLVTIGMGGGGLASSIANNYLHKGQYYATSTGSALYAKDLHDGLAVKFMRIRTHFVSARAISFPASEGLELSNNNFTFMGVISNWTDDEYMAYVKFEVKNLSTGTTVTTKFDSIVTNGGFSTQYSGPTYQGLPCGAYQVTMTVSIPSLGSDSWVYDNVLRRNFYVISNQNFPFYEDFNSGVSGCNWVNLNAEARPAVEVMYDPVAPRTGDDNAVVLDRTNAAGRMYNDTFSGDTLTSAPINLSGKSNVYLNFAYQRGLKTDNRDAGTHILLRTGPEAMIAGSSGPADPADSLVIEGLLASGTRYNPSASSWTVLHTLTGGFDTKTNKVRILLPSNVISDHFRIRFRLKSREHGSLFSPVHDDNDSWVVDGIQVISPSNGQTEFEVLGFNLGAGHHTRIPRDVRFLRPSVRIGNNGRNAGLGSYILRMIIHDQLGREVYHKSQGFDFPNSFADTTITMLPWDIKGSQGGVFSVKAYFESNFSEVFRGNDTNYSTRSLVIGDVYAIDDNDPDTAGTLTAAPLEWYYDFLPVTDDSIRGVDMFFLAPQTATSWQLEFRRGSVLLGTRQFSVTPSNRGWLRGSFTPLHLTADTIRVHVTETVGTPIGGDASRGLIYQTSNVTPFSFRPLFPEIVDEFYLANTAPYYGGATTAANLGVLIPMLRFVYTGSSQYLPVELIRFAGARIGENVELQWKTAKEENSLGFTVERLEGEDWNLVANVAARNARLGADYATEDRFAPRSELNYRLTEHDLDGTSRVIGHVKIGADGSSIVDLQVYPNPAVNTLSIYANGGVIENVTLRDALGREVKKAFSMNELNVSDLATGTYFLQVEVSGQTFTRAVTITR
jgi:hypothetical protein